MTDAEYTQSQIYDIPQDFHELHYYPHYKTKAKQVHINLYCPMLTIKRSDYMKTYHVQGFSKSKEGVTTFNYKSVQATCSNEAEELILLEVGWNAKITMCKEVG